MANLKFRNTPTTNEEEDREQPLASDHAPTAIANDAFAAAEIPRAPPVPEISYTPYTSYHSRFPSEMSTLLNPECEPAAVAAITNASRHEVATNRTTNLPNNDIDYEYEDGTSTCGRGHWTRPCSRRRLFRTALLLSGLSVAVVFYSNLLSRAFAPPSSESSRISSPIKYLNASFRSIRGSHHDHNEGEEEEVHSSLVKPPLMTVIASDAAAAKASKNTASDAAAAKESKKAKKARKKAKNSSKEAAAAALASTLASKFVLKTNAAVDDEIETDANNSNNETDTVDVDVISREIDDLAAYERCPYVIDTFVSQNVGVPNDLLRPKYHAQATDANVFYRATALLFWKDFGAGMWGGIMGPNNGKSSNGKYHQRDGLQGLVGLFDTTTYADGTPMSPKSTWTWITGDQHLSNFGAWRNRGGNVVYGVNDFDEAAIYDFQIDVLRIAVSIVSHGFTNGLNAEQIEDALQSFTYVYVKTVINYVGGDKELLFEITPTTATGALLDFLQDADARKGQQKLMKKFTEVVHDNNYESGGGDSDADDDDDNEGVDFEAISRNRRFTRDETTRLVDVSPEIEAKIRAEFTSDKYGASLMQMGWKVHGWDDDFFTVLDVARRVGSGVGSYGVDRYYVLLKGVDTIVDDGNNHNVILDVKYEPAPAVFHVLDDDGKAWYATLFHNHADRAAQAQRKLTSYTDPFVGWLEIDGDPYIVRQRSPWKQGFEIGTVTEHHAYTEFVEQVAIATATSHSRGTVSKSPGQFKHVIKALLAGGRDRQRWSDLVTKIAFSYREQVVLDYECFRDHVNVMFPMDASTE